MSEIKSVPEALASLGDIYARQNKLYGDNYKNAGKVLKGLFPNGLYLRSEDDFNRFALFNHVINKVTRYAQMFDRGGHHDSLDDLSVYAQMLAECDEKNRNGKK